MAIVAVLLVVVIVFGAAALFVLPRGRRSRYGTVEDRPPGRD